VVVLLGPRQCGKTTISRFFSDTDIFDRYDLENPQDKARLEQALLVLSEAKGRVIIDEVQKRPDLFELIRVLVDRPDNKASFLLLGSASPSIVRGASESLAGRCRFIEMSGFTIEEVGPERQRELWLRGGFPRSFLSPSEKASRSWREDFIRSFLERDIPQLGFSIPTESLRRFWSMVAHDHGNVWNASELARSLGTGEATMRRYLDIMSGVFLVRQLPPWFENGPKRYVKSPKIYIRDTGLLHSLPSIEDTDGLFGHPKYGASWEGFVIEQILARVDTRDAYFWETHSGAELDLLLFIRGKRIGVEAKAADAPVMGKSMRIAIEDLKLDALYIVYPGEKSYWLSEAAQALPLPALLEILTSQID
jgi:uncharacterized protein